MDPRANSLAVGPDRFLFFNDGDFRHHFLPQLAAHPLMTKESKKSALTEDSKLKEKKAATTTGLPMPVLSTSEDLGDWNFERDLGFPGEFPFTRGVYPTMYRGRLWTMRQYAGFGTAAESNARYRYLLERGQRSE